MDLQRLKDRLFARGAELGFSDLELYVERERSFQGSLFKGEVDRFSLSEEGGAALRGLYRGKMGYAYTERLDESAVDMLLEAAKAGAEVTDSEEEALLYEGSSSYPEARLWSEPLAAAEPQEQLAWLKALEAECYRLDDRVALLQYCTVYTREKERTIFNTRGLDCRERTNAGVALLAVLVRQGEEGQAVLRVPSIRDFRAEDPKRLAREMVEEALSYLGAEPVESREYPVLFRNTAAASLLGAFAPAFSGEEVLKGRSLLAGKLGQSVAGANITIVDDPLLEGGLGSRTFDAEGVASRRLALVEGGVLRTYLHNLKTARAAGAEPTGHGHKGSYKGAVSIAPSNLFIQPGDRAFTDLVAAMDEGVIVTEMMGHHSGTNPISGDFSLAAKGYYVRGGRIQRPVNQITVAGHFFAMLQQVEAVGSDLAFWMPLSESTGSPSLLVKALAVTGK